MVSSAKKTRLEYVIETFFKTGTPIKDLKNVLQLKVDTLKDFDEKVVAFLSEIKVEKIKDLIEFKSEDLEKRLIDRKFSREIVDYIIVSGKILKKIVEMKTKEKEEIPTKIAIMGMQNAGKTSLINFLLAQSPDEKYKETEPTVSVDHKNMKLGDHQLAIWDFGGQKSFRDEYLKNPDEFFVNTGLLIFVVDSQDDTFYADAIEYLHSILDIMQKMNPNLHVVIDLHKYDPDLTSDIDFLVKTQWLEEKFKNLLKSTKFSYEFMRTSIFSEIAGANAPEIARNLKETVLLRTTEKSKIPELNMLKSILFVQAKIYYAMMTNLAEITGRLQALESRIPAGMPPGLAAAPATNFPSSSSTGLPPPPPPARFPGYTPAEDPKMSIVNELKEMFKKRRISVP
ncbi:MAG: ADP-ribosylation factor-like protein [Candidatus Sigynarchaeota archaeon]